MTVFKVLFPSKWTEPDLEQRMNLLSRFGWSLTAVSDGLLVFAKKENELSDKERKELNERGRIGG